MNKTNELIEKAIARARVKGHSKSGAGASATRVRSNEESSEETTEYRQKRIASKRGVVVRRRSRPSARPTAADEPPVEAEAAVEAEAPTERVVAEAAQPPPEPPPPAPVAEEPAPVAQAEALAEPAVEAAVVKEPSEKAAPPATTSEATTKAQAAAKPSAKAASPTATKRRRAPAADAARVIYRPPGTPSKPQPRQEAAPPPQAAAPAAEPVEEAPVRRRVETPRSLEDILAEERGYSTTFRKAVVVAPAPDEPKAAARPAKGRVATTPAAGAAAAEPTKRGRHTYKADARPAAAGAAPAGAGRKRRRERSGRRSSFAGDFAASRRRRAAGRKSGKKTQLTTPKAIKRVVEMEDSLSVGDLAHQMSVKAGQVIKQLMGMGVMATVNQLVDFETASLVASEFDYEVKSTAFDEAAFIPEVEDAEEDTELRAPVVTIMGHVDHGKTTLLDRIRSSDIASGEAGGITQHIGAYKVKTPGGTVVFLDTPGHEAFTSMRARGAEVTDIVVLVVAADDGVMPQTIEAIKHAQEADVPIIVAVNKIDKEGAQPEVVQRKLAEYNLVPEAWGGDTIFCPVSAKVGTGIPELLDMILLQAEVLELKANPGRSARAAVIEAELDKGRGAVATVLVQTGTLRVGDYVVAGAFYGRVRAALDEHGNSLDSAGPSTPVQILGLGGVPEAGDQMAVVDDLEIARSIADERASRVRQRTLAESNMLSVDDLMRQMQESAPEEVRLVVKADVQGSLEAVIRSFEALSTDKVRVNIISTGVGAISESDITHAQASDAVVMGFNVQPDTKAGNLAEQVGVAVKSHSIIYEALDDLRALMTSKLAPIYKERVLGHAEVREMFSIPKVGIIAGCMVTNGKILRNSMARLNRAGDTVWEGKLTSLKRFKDDAREVDKGFECGIGLDGYNALEPGDIIESYAIDEVAPTL